MTALPKVDWYFDVISPYAYLQWTQLHPVSQRAEITPIPVLFAGFLDAWGTKGPAEMPPKKLFVFRHVRWMAGQLGVPYNTPPQHPFNPLKALRLAIALKADPQAIHKLFTAVWVDGHLPDNPEGWAAMAAAQGLSVDEADALTADPAVKRTLLDNGQRALDAGLWGVPSFVIDGDIFWGLDATNMVLDRLTDPALLTGAQDDRIRALSASAELAAMTDVLWRVALHVPSRAAPAFEAALEPFCLSVSWFGDDDTGRPWTVEGLAPAMPDPDRLTEALATTAGALGVAPPDPEVTPLPPRDWLTENFRAFPPVAAGRFFVHGSHFEGAPPPGCRVLRLDAATAFGSGEHATTKGCLLALDALRHPPRQIPRRVLDMGCGSGILAMGAAKAWGVSVLACDIDPESVRVTRANARNNGVGHLVAALRSDGYRDPAVRAGGPYDLILANILARPLMAMAGDLASVLAPGGLAVLSGFVTRDANRVLAAHRARGLVQVRRRVIDDWVTLVVRKAG